MTRVPVRSILLLSERNRSVGVFRVGNKNEAKLVAVIAQARRPLQVLAFPRRSCRFSEEAGE